MELAYWGSALKRFVSMKTVTTPAASPRAGASPPPWSCTRPRPRAGPRADIIAEGVETRGQLACLRELKCEYGQGFLFSKPVGADGAEQIIAETRAGASPAHAEPETIAAPVA